MKSFPGFLPVLQNQLEGLSFNSLERVNREGGIEINDLLNYLTRPTDYTVDRPYKVDDSSIIDKEKCIPEDYWIGRESLNTGETSLCFLVNDESIFKQGSCQHSELESQLMKFSWVKEIWIIVSPEHKEKVQKISSSVGARVKILTHYESFSLAPNNELLLAGNEPVFHSCGPGDLLYVAGISGLLEIFKNDGGKYIFVTSVCSLGFNPNPTLLGTHKRHKKPVTWEVSSRSSDSRRGILCEHEGFPQIVEKFRLSSLTEDNEFSLNSNDNFIFNADLDFSTVKWKWHRVKVKRNNRLEVQFIRTLYDLSSFFQTTFVNM